MVQKIINIALFFLCFISTKCLAKESADSRRIEKIQIDQNKQKEDVNANVSCRSECNSQFPTIFSKNAYKMYYSAKLCPRKYRPKFFIGIGLAGQFASGELPQPRVSPNYSTAYYYEPGMALSFSLGARFFESKYIFAELSLVLMDTHAFAPSYSALHQTTVTTYNNGNTLKSVTFLDTVYYAALNIGTHIGERFDIYAIVGGGGVYAFQNSYYNNSTQRFSINDDLMDSYPVFGLGTEIRILNGLALRFWGIAMPTKWSNHYLGNLNMSCMFTISGGVMFYL